jgi:hypothetical protein
MIKKLANERKELRLIEDNYVDHSKSIRDWINSKYDV